MVYIGIQMLLIKLKNAGKRYHINKTKACNKVGIRLIHIFENEWDDNEELIKSKLKHLLGNFDGITKIRASKCYVEEINNTYKREFLNNNHMQGSDNSAIKLGLWYPNDEGDILVAVMTFCKPRKALGQNNSNNKIAYNYELSRFAIDINYQVYGAFGKLFKYFKDNYEWNSIITYADLKWSDYNYNNTIYIKNGFTFKHYSDPSYWYLDPENDILEYRYKYRKNNLKKLFPDIYEDDLSEKDIMEIAGYHRVFDCGNAVFTYER
jgi:hypothetical protein